MRKYAVTLVLVLTGCINSYQPTLSAIPSDQAKYESDLKSCKNRPLDNPPDCRGAALSGVFGAAGYLAYQAGSSPQDVCNMSARELIDMCMENRGYKLAKP